MAYKIYFDINVLLDLTLQRSNFKEVELIMNEIQNGFKKGFLTGATIHTLSYFLSKQYDQKKVKELLFLGICVLICNHKSLKIKSGTPPTLFVVYNPSVIFVHTAIPDGVVFEPYFVR